MAISRGSSVTRRTRSSSIVDMPITLAGISRHEPSERDGGGGGRVGDRAPGAGGRQGSEDVRPGSRSAIPGARTCIRIDGRIVVIDYAHNEAGMIGLTEVLDGLRTDRAARCGWRSARPETGPTASFTRSRSAPRWARITWRSRSSCSTSVAGRARTSSNDSARARARPASSDVPAYDDELVALAGDGRDRGDRRRHRGDRARDASGDLRVARRPTAANGWVPRTSGGS